ncbi:MAG: hypothetical protein JJU00_18080 [Opitutales bacterium]|nr:hypothetical protein [Opitutales bacterium]
MVLAAPLWGDAVTQVGLGDAAGTAPYVEVPFFFVSGEGPVAMQFDFAVPQGVDLESVVVGGGVPTDHQLDFEVLEGGLARVVLYSPTNELMPDGRLLSLRFHAQGGGSFPEPDLVAMVFSNADGVRIDRAPGFPQPAILAHPQSQVVAAGTGVSLSVAASGVDIAFQWYRGAFGQTGNPVAGGTAATLHVAAIAETTTFWARVTDAFGVSLDSAAATVTVVDTVEISMDPTWREVEAPSGGGVVAVTATAAVPWTAVSDADWLAVVAGSGTGSGEIEYTYTANPGFFPRVGTISIGETVFTLMQAGSEPESIFRHLPTVGGTAWRESEWFGWVDDSDWPWVWHDEHGWLRFYIAGTEDETLFYSIFGDLGWVFTGKTLYNESHTLLYSHGRGAWLHYSPGGNPWSRSFLNLNSNTTFVVSP